MKKLDQLTFTRFLAALTVVFFHAGGSRFAFPFTPLIDSGPVSVSFFFVLSGFVMSLAYYKPDRRFDFSSYSTSRIARIFPVYWISFLFVCFIYIDSILKIKWPKVLASIFLVQAWIPRYSQSFNIAAWSLSVEVFFYVLFPFLAIWFYRQPLKRLIWISLGFWTLSQFLHYYLVMQAGNQDFLQYFPLFHLNSFLLGATGGIWYLTESQKHPLSQKVNFGFMLAGIFAVCLLLIVGTTSLGGFPSRFGFSLINGVLAPFFLVIILTLALDTTRLSRIMSHPWLVLLGDASYALYILHVPIRWFLEKFPFTSTISGLFLGIYLFVVLLLSVLVFVFIEKPAREFLRSHPRAIWMFMLDALAVAASILFGFIFRLGMGTGFDSYAPALNLILRAGLVIYPASFLTLGLYSVKHVSSPFSRFLTPPLIAVSAGTLMLVLLLVFAQNNGTITSYPRSALILIWLIMLALISSIRYIDHRLQAKAPSRTDRA